MTVRVFEVGAVMEQRKKGGYNGFELYEPGSEHNTPEQPNVSPCHYHEWRGRKERNNFYRWWMHTLPPYLVEFDGNKFLGPVGGWGILSTLPEIPEVPGIY
ncbi:hypothetical protein LCGC14_0232800 [marine sediment metagenome]|uniref:Uncharacterized protein n=1 Tax=marine sediment metagenome TaxID=412755 RepID=A0A0F9UER7_9ZZZZ